MNSQKNDKQISLLSIVKKADTTIDNKDEVNNIDEVDSTDEVDENLDIEKSEKAVEWVSNLYEWVGTLVVSIIIIIFAFLFFFRVVGVVGDSMLPTLIGASHSGNFQDSSKLSGDRLLLSTFLYKPKRGDIVVIDRYVEEPMIKRIVAVGGDTIEFIDGMVFVNSVEDEYTLYYTSPHEMDPGPLKIEEGYFLVLGDNRQASKDSRYSDIGFVSGKDIVGKAVFRFAPLSRFGFIS